MKSERRWQLDHPEAMKASRKKWRSQNKSQIRRIQRNYRRRKRKELINLLGGKCTKCGFVDQRALQIDHVNGGGKKEIESKASYNYYRDIYLAIQNGSKEYQLLCANCNWIKRAERKEVNFIRDGEQE